MSVREADSIAATTGTVPQENRAGSGEAGLARDRLIPLFKQHGVLAKIEVAKAGGEAPLLAHRAVKNGAGLVIAAGGDGTVSSVASALLNTETVLGVLPLGTLNHFAKDLGIPAGLEEAVANLRTGQVTQIDVGEVNGHHFLNNSSLGLYPSIVRQREETQKKGHSKWMAFIGAALHALRRYPRLYVSLQPKDGSEIEEETPFVFIGNNRYQDCGLHIGQRSCLNAGRLWIYRAPRASRADLFRLALHALVGRSDPGALLVFDADACRIRTRKRNVHVATDGEVRTLKTPLNYRILPKALKVIAPVVPTPPGQSD
jgi:YegS/Rv2252/BmrU family lipid kinase